MAYKVKIVRVGDVVSGRLEVDAEFYSDVAEEKTLTKTFSFSADSAPKTKLEAMQVFKDFKRQLNDLANVMENLRPEVDKEVV